MIKKAALFVYLFLLSTQSYSQITITQQDVEDLFAPGKTWITYSNYEVNGSVSMNIGNASTSVLQSWLVPNMLYPDTSVAVTVDPAGTGYHNYFPDATHSTMSSGVYMGYDYDSYQFRQVTSTEVWDLGMVAHLYGSGLDTIIVEENMEVGLVLPVALGQTYQDYYDSSDGGFGIYNVEEVIKTCDAYGNISFLGNNEAALRITTETAHRVYMNGSLINTWYQHEYNWITKAKGFVDMDADTSTILSGEVPIQSIEVTVVANSTGVDENNNLINSFALSQNYPNPFNPSTIISYQLATAGQVSLKVYDVLGNEVATLVNKVQDPGSHSINFNASNLSTGVYFYQLKSGNYSLTKKMTLIK